MADILTLAKSFTAKGSVGTPFTQDLLNAVDVSLYDCIDFQLTGLAMNNASGFTVSLLTSMQKKSDDASWVVVGTTGAFTASPSFAQMVVPAADGTPMLRYLRFRVNFLGSTTSATFSAVGLARRGVRGLNPSWGPRLIPLCDYVTNGGPLSAVGRATFDPADYTIGGRTLGLSLSFVGDVSRAGVTATVKLHNLSDGTDDATTTVTVTTAAFKSVGPISVPTSAKIYELEVSHNGLPTDYLTLGGAVLRVAWS